MRAVLRVPRSQPAPRFTARRPQHRCGAKAGDGASIHRARWFGPTRSVLYESGQITVYYRVDASNRLLMGGRGPMQWISDPSAVNYLTRYAVRLWPALRGIGWTHGLIIRVTMTT